MHLQGLLTPRISHLHYWHRILQKSEKLKSDNVFNAT